MTKLTLLTKISDDSRLEKVRKALENPLDGLEVVVKIFGAVVIIFSYDFDLP